MFTAREVAEKIGASRPTVLRIAKQRSLGKFYGYQKFFSAKEVKEIQRFCRFQVGRPKLSANN